MFAIHLDKTSLIRYIQHISLLWIKVYFNLDLNLCSFLETLISEMHLEQSKNFVFRFSS